MARLNNVYLNLSLAVIAILLLTGCSTLSLQKARTEFYSGNLNEADYALEECKGVSERDVLLCHMEKGLILHYMEVYDESAEALLNASQLIKIQEQISVTEQSSAMVINDNVTTYKGEYSERLWVHTYLMMDYLLQYIYEDALVEAKQALELYDKYPESLEGDHFTRALIALCYENMNMPDDARIEYEKLAEEMGVEEFRPDPVAPGEGELILFIAQGRAPTKVSSDVVLPPTIRISVPVYAGGSPPVPVSLLSDGYSLFPVKISTDLGQVARRSLDDRSAQYLSRQALRAGAKEAIAREVGEDTVIGEVFARAILFLLEEADTRSWETLPGGLTLIRIPLEAGIHDLEISSAGSETIQLNGIDIPEGGRAYRSIRF
ncbi:MAG: hypothetical protein JW944_13835 [Deltaproteobacteria bacterium]|nr:hypothetical protein [Deltaproteobacteria bacterium]